jgi:hypothetical protein
MVQLGGDRVFHSRGCRLAKSTRIGHRVDLHQRRRRRDPHFTDELVTTPWDGHDIRMVVA